MLMTNFLEKRKSIRNFQDKSLSKDELDKIKEILNNFKSEKEFCKVNFFENGKIISKGLAGKAGYAGVMIEAPHYIALDFNGNDNLSILEGGYLLESINTAVTNLNIDTCWITVDYVDSDLKKSLFGEEFEELDYLIAVGHGKKKKFFDPEVTSARKALDEIVFKNNIGENISIEELENYGLFDVFSSIRYAPSHKNLQPWRFVLKDNTISAFMKKSDEDMRSLVDMGVIAFYLKEMCKDSGIKGNWKFEISDAGDYYKIGDFNI